MRRAWFRSGALAVLTAAAAAVLQACSSGQAGSIPIAASPNVSASSTLQFAVGTATIGTASGSSVGLNVVATFRQPNGSNATNVNTPTLTAPKGVNFGPLLGNANVVGGVNPAQLAALATQARALAKGVPLTIPPSFSDGFGPLVGVFGYGLAADNLISNTDYTTVQTASGLTLGTFCAGIGTNYFDLASGVPNGFGSVGLGAYYGLPPALGTGVTTSNNVRSAELALPIPSGVSGGNCVCPSSCAPNNSGIFVDGAFPVQYFGGPPAWPSPQGYGNYSYFVGYPLGFTTFTASPSSGAYTLAVSYPTGPTYASFNTVSAAATLRSVAPLPVFPAPVLTINADGSGVVNVNVPAGIKEAVITIISTDCDLAGRDLNGSNYANHFALETQQTGPQTLFLSSALGPPSAVTGLPTHTFCTTSDVQAQNAAVNGALSTYAIHTAVAAVGFDYGAVEASYPFNTSSAPPIAGPNGQADVTTSYPTFTTTTITLPTGS